MSLSISAVINCSIIVLLLFYETEGVPVTTTVTLPAEEQSIIDLDVSSDSEVNGNSPTQVTMSIWARKAGGHLKPEFIMLQTTESSSLDNANNNLKDEVEQAQISSTASELLSTIMTPMNAKSSPVEEDHVKIRQQEKVNDNRNKNPDLSSSSSSSFTSREEGYEYENSDEEKECPEDQFWHIRGKRCVPVQCPGGNHWRDVNTGVCILRNFRTGYGRKRNRLNKFSGRISGTGRYMHG